MINSRRFIKTLLPCSIRIYTVYIYIYSYIQGASTVGYISKMSIIHR